MEVLGIFGCVRKSTLTLLRIRVILIDMSVYSHKRSFNLRYTDNDFQDELSVSALLSIVQQTACTSADELGFGYDDLKPKNIGFLVINNYGEIYTQPRIGETVTVETWPLPPRRVFFERHYRVTGDDGRCISALASRWCMVDLNKFTILPPEALGEVHARCPYRAEKSVEVPSWRIEKLGETGKEAYRMSVRASHCDHYFHANNTRYADFFLDCFSMEELKSRTVKSFSIAYHKQAREGAELSFVRKDAGNTSVLEARCEGETLSQFSVTFGNR